MVDRRLVEMERRLNRRLNGVVNEIVRKLLRDPVYNPREYDIVIRGMYKDYVRGVYSLGEGVIVNHPMVELTEPVGSFRLESIIESRCFVASQRTLDRLHGNVYNRIREGIREGRALGKTNRILEGEFRDMNRGKLMRISRTETQSIYNQAKMETMRASQLVKFKQWVSSGLENMRESHAALDGEVVPVDESDPVEGVVNYACTMVPLGNWHGAYVKKDKNIYIQLA